MTIANAGCANCNEDKKPPAAKLRIEAPPVIVSEGRPEPPPELPPGTPIEGDVFKPATPATVAGFSAVGPGESVRMPLANGGVLTKFMRSYKRGPQTLELELSDSLHAPLLPKVIEQQQGTERKTDSSEMTGTTVNGRPAVLMFQSAARTATASVLLGSRVLLNLRVNPVDDLQSVVEVAAAIPLAPLDALIPKAEPAAAPSEQAPSGEAVEDPGEAKPAPARAAPKAAPSPN